MLTMVKRITAGITGHFKTRITEWFAAVLLLQLGWTLVSPPASFPPVHRVVRDGGTDAGGNMGCNHAGHRRHALARPRHRRDVPVVPLLACPLKSDPP
ncbi:UNVERIFIED_ORG: hypothetical protein M2442_005309 [Methylorubrum zatmanii]|nr:hypothetical protein [Methylorubrum zatmanii]